MLKKAGQKAGEIIRKGAGHAGRLSARGFGHTMAWFGRHIVFPIVLGATIIAGLWFLIPHLSNRLVESVTGPTLAPQEALSAAERKCFALAVADDAGDDVDAQVFVARVYKNAADQLVGPAKFCPTWQSFRVTMAPSQPLSDARSPRNVGFWYSVLYWTAHQNLIAAEAIVDRYEKRDSSLWDERTFPWLKCARWITRLPGRQHAWEKNELMEKETVVVHTTREATKLRCLRP